MGRPKTELREALEEYFNRIDPELVDDWFTWTAPNKREIRRIRAMVQYLKETMPEAANAICVVDRERNVVWVHR